VVLESRASEAENALDRSCGGANRDRLRHILVRDAPAFPEGAFVRPATGAIVASVFFLSTMGMLGVVCFLPYQEPADAMVLQGPFTLVAGHAYKVNKIIQRSEYDTTGYQGSTVELYEDDKRLGPAHASFSDIATLGGGRFTTWQNSMMNDIYFSSSDGTDPNTNGRTYRAFDPNALDPYPAVIIESDGH
jgi:hypothetical protein